MKNFFLAKKPIHPLIKILLFLAIMAVLYVLIILPVDFILQLLDPASGKNKIIDLVTFTINYSDMAVVAILGAYISLRLFDNKRLRDIGLGLKKEAIKELFTGLFIGIILTGLIFIIELAFGWIRITGYAGELAGSYNFLFLYKSIIMYIGVALMEEIFTRGYIMHQLDAFKGKKAAIAISSVLFGLLHLPSAIGTWAVFVAPFTLSLIGVLFGLLFYQKMSLWIPIGFHFSWNFFEYEFFSLTGYGRSRSVFFVTELTGPQFWVGLPKSGFGPEVGALGVLTIASCILAILVYNRLKRPKSEKICRVNESI